MDKSVNSIADNTEKLTKILKILYVDDENLNLSMLGVLLRHEFDIVKTTSSLEALKIIKQSNDIQAVISDMKMPVMNGLKFIKKAKEFRNDIPYFILTGYDINLEIREALKNNFIQGVFHKPIDKELISSTLRKFLS